MRGKNQRGFTGIVAVKCCDTLLLFVVVLVICRIKKLKETFESKYGEPPLFYACAPGRVNLIGNFIQTVYCVAFFFIIG